ncbi:crossover junction endonuclease MUS81 [Armigeres subalbatus]|uniref:crossover junction endonuclease MUS81 n=1 Tax=Armigeres subalbatus TaxID=124917 RepID=UPI002ED5A359
MMSVTTDKCNGIHKRKKRVIRLVERPSSELVSESPSVRRIQIKYSTCPNPLYERLLQEMIVEAQEKDAKSRMVLQKALASLKRYPLPIYRPRDCAILVGFGMGVCESLTSRLANYAKQGCGQFDREVNKAEIERVLNDKEGDYCMQLLTPEDDQHSVEESDKPDKEMVEQSDEIFKIPDDSVFDNMDLLDNLHLRVSSPKAILLVDTQETIGKSKTYLDYTLKELKQHNIEYEVRRLSVGDFLWIVRDDSGEEFILPYIVERKRMDDLASSIKDGRFHEQKFRLKQCRLANVVYLIEHLGNNRQVGVPEATLSQAVLNTFVQDFTVKYTENNHHTVLYLSTMTKLLNKNLLGKTFWNTTNLSSETTSSKFDIQQSTIPLISFESFSKQSSKTGDSTVREIFMKQLLQIKLLTIDKANAIVDKYPTPKKLYLAYEKCTSEAEKEKLLNLPYGPAKTMIGLKLSKTIYQLFMSDVYGK